MTFRGVMRFGTVEPISRRTYIPSPPCISLPLELPSAQSDLASHPHRSNLTRFASHSRAGNFKAAHEIYVKGCSAKYLDYPDYLLEMWLAFEHQNGTLSDLEFTMTKVKRQRRGLEAKRFRVSPFFPSDRFSVFCGSWVKRSADKLCMCRRLKQLANRLQSPRNQRPTQWKWTISSIRSSTPHQLQNDLATKRSTRLVRQRRNQRSNPLNHRPLLLLPPPFRRSRRGQFGL